MRVGVYAKGGARRERVAADGLERQAEAREVRLGADQQYLAGLNAQVLRSSERRGGQRLAGQQVCGQSYSKTCKM